MNWESSLTPGLVVATLLLSSGCAPVRCAEPSVPSILSVEFNQLVLEGRASSVDPEGPGKVAPDFADPRSIARFVLKSAPRDPIVYPTEMYYYFNFPLGSRVVSGNIRLVDAITNAVSVGYFDACNPREVHYREFRDGEEGVRIVGGDSQQVLVEIDGVCRRFTLDRSALASEPASRLLDGERFVSGLRDESGYFLWLIYYPPLRSFYYVLNPDQPLPERWQRGESQRIQTFFGERSRFCFLRDPRTGRCILVGVLARNIELNNWYDGPFDQVPPRLLVKSMLEEAYPYVLDAGGIDEHGNFLKLTGQRVAISPYRDYSSGPALERELEQLVIDDPSPAAWCRATYEWKKDWRPPAQMRVGAHEQAISGAWPANHWGPSSNQWGPDHAPATSRAWPPSHAIDRSRSAGG